MDLDQFGTRTRAVHEDDVGVLHPESLRERLEHLIGRRTFAGASTHVYAQRAVVAAPHPRTLGARVDVH